MHAVGTKPAPLPTKPGSPEAWLGRPLVRLDYTDRKGDASIVAAGTRATTDGRVFEQLVTKSFTDAVDFANYRARKSLHWAAGTHPTHPAAQAILQGHDGAYYVTQLATFDKYRYSLTLIGDGDTGDVKQSWTALDPAVKAIVGATSWVNFTSDPYKPTFVS